MSHWLDTDRFDDDSDIEQDPPRTFDPLTLIAAQLAGRFTPLGDWIRQGACAGSDMDPALWDPPPSVEELAEMPEKARPSARDSARRQRTAAAVCHGCPVRDECLADARANEVTVGVRGGVLFTSNTGRSRHEHDLIALMHGGRLHASPAGRGRTASAA